MLNTIRIIIASTMLFGCTVFNAPAQAGTLNRLLPRAEQPAKADPCKGSWPYIVRSCLA